MSDDVFSADEAMLSKEELAITLELGNITSGSASSTLAMLIDPNLEMGQPEVVEFANIMDLTAKGLPQNCVMAVLRLMNGFQIPIAFFIETGTAIKLAQVMMGGSPSEGSDQISDIELSAVGEAISQMMGASANSISQFLSHPMEISPPEVVLYTPDKLMEMIPEAATNAMVMVKYQLTGSKVLPDCQLLQVTPIYAMRQQIEFVKTAMPDDIPDFLQPQATATPDPFMMTPQPTPEPELAGVGAWAPPPAEPAPASFDSAFGAFPSGGGGAPPNQPPRQPVNPVTVQPVEFPSFDQHVPAYGGINKNLELVMDVCLNLTVELGRTELPIKEVLELTRGSVIELNRVAGESVDLFANGKMIAKGEVVVIEDNFGLRITSIVSPADRLRGL